MALTLRFQLVENDNGTLIDITDITGLYNVLNNPNGYGAPNPDWPDATAVKIKFESMDEEEVFTQVGSEVDYFGSIIPVDYFSLQEPYTLSVSLEDGWYRITYTVTIDSVDYVAVQYKAFYSDARCCFKNKALKESGCKCNCKEGRFELWEIGAAIEAVQTAEQVENGLAVLDAITTLKKLCKKCGCNCD